MKPEVLVSKILESITNGKPKTITYNGIKIRISQSIINKLKNHKVLDNINYDEIDKQAKEGGFLFLLPLIFGGLAAAGAVAGGASGIASAVNKKKAEDAANREKRRHNLEMEKLAKGSGIKDILASVKQFNNATKKTVKEGLSKLIDQIDTGETEIHKEGDGLILKDIRSGDGLYLSKYKGDGIKLNPY